MFQSWNILNECCCYRSCFILKWKVPIINAGTAEKAGSDRYIQRMTEDPRGDKPWTQVVRSSKDLSLIPWHVMASVFGSGRRQCEAGSRISQWRIMYFQQKNPPGKLQPAGVRSKFTFLCPVDVAKLSRSRGIAKLSIWKWLSNSRSGNVSWDL